MDCRTGEIIFDECAELLDKKHLARIEEEDVPRVKRMNKERRKNWMRNQLCECGSGRKFKKCCWYKKVR